MSASDAGSRLFHAIVVMGLSFGATACGGQQATTASGDGGRDASGSSDATTAGDDGSAEGASADASDAALVGDVVSASPDAGSDAYGYPDDAGNCVCPPPRPAVPCCPAASGMSACGAWPCYV
jgi:hypothetical protein